MTASRDRISIKPSCKTLHILNVLIMERKTSSFFSLSLGILKGNRAATRKTSRGTNLVAQNSRHISQMEDEDVFSLYSLGSGYFSNANSHHSGNLWQL